MLGDDAAAHAVDDVGKAKAKHQKSEYPTLPGQLGYLNSYYCPVCGKHLFSAYDKDMKKDREDGYYFHVSNDFNYCSKCGQLLDLDEWRRTAGSSRRIEI